MHKLTDLQAIDVIKRANERLKPEYQWECDKETIRAIQLEFWEKEENGNHDIELDSYTTLSGHCEEITCL